MNSANYQHFYEPLLAWYEQHGRKNLPWQQPRSAYRIWIAEIMLQQTQVKTVIPYFNRFMERFSTIWALANAPEDEVLAHWSGLGYYSRARNIHKTANIICQSYQGLIPKHVDQLLLLPGIGPSTAAAIASQAFNQHTAILDGNVKRVLCRYFEIAGYPEQSKVKQLLWQLASNCMPSKNCAAYTQAIMDLGATCCKPKQANCINCPLQQTCMAYIHNTVNQYPQSKPKKNLPIKHEQFLFLYSLDNRIYLEKRPSTGLWGGLWCTPTIQDKDCPITHIQQTYGLTYVQSHPLLKIKHSFSHFHLHIKAIALQAVPMENRLAEQPGTWFKANQMPNLGLPKPVRTLITHFLTHLLLDKKRT